MGYLLFFRINLLRFLLYTFSLVFSQWSSHGVISLSSKNKAMVDILPSERYEHHLNTASVPTDFQSGVSCLEPVFEKENLRSFLLKCGETIALRNGLHGSQLIEPKCKESSFEGYTESPWYETPFYRKLRGNKPIPPDPPETEPESTDEDLMNNMMGNYTTGPSTPDTSDIDEVVEYFPTGSESDDDERENSIDKNKNNLDATNKDGEEDKLDIFKILKDDDPTVNQWSKNIEEDMDFVEDNEHNFWDLD